MTPEVEAAWISGLCGVAATVIAAVTAALIGQRIASGRELEAKLVMAKADIEFLLEVERTHCAMHRDTVGRPHKNLVRADVLRTGRFTWSGKFTPGRNRHSSQ